MTRQRFGGLCKTASGFAGARLNLSGACTPVALLAYRVGLLPRVPSGVPSRWGSRTTARSRFAKQAAIERAE